MRGYNERKSCLRIAQNAKAHIGTKKELGRPEMRGVPVSGKRIAFVEALYEIINIFCVD